MTPVRYPDDVPLLSDGEVTLRAHRPDDLEAVYEQCTDPDSQAFTTIPVPYTRDDAATFLASRARCWEDATAYPFAVEAPTGIGPGRYVGSVGIKLVAPGIGEIGFLTHPAARGRGLTTAAVRLIVDWAFDTERFRTIVWRAVTGNIGSWRVAWRTGFRFDGTTRGTLPHRGQALDGWIGTLRSSDSREPKNRWLAQPRLDDGHVVLRTMCGSDEERYLQTVHDPETHRWLSEIPFPRDPLAFRAHLREIELWPALGQSVFWSIADAQTDAYVGSFGLFGFVGLDHSSAEVGYRSHPDARGRGYVSGALRLGMGLAFAPEADGGYGLERLSLGAGAGNQDSQAVARACGFTETGRDRRCYRLADDSVVDLIRFDLLRDEWAAAPAHRSEV